MSGGDAVPIGDESGAEGPALVLLLFPPGRNREVLAEWLDSIPGYEPVVGDPAAESAPHRFDIAITDAETMPAVRRRLDERRRAASPLLLPCLLVVPGRSEQSGRAGVAGLEDGTAAVVDDVIAAPVEKREFRRRLGMLLRARRLSLRLAERRDQYRQLVDVLPEGVVIADDGVVRWVNAAAEALLGSDLAGEPLQSAAVAGVDALERVLDGRVTGQRFVDVDFLGPDGVVECQVAGVTVPYEGDDATQVVVRDVTEHRRREERFAVLARVLRHNLRNELNVIQAHAEMATENDGAAADHAGAVLAATENLTELVERAERVSRVPDDDAARVDVAATVRTVAESARRTFPEATVDTDLPESAPAIAGAQLAWALDEAVRNAIEHHDGDPRVELAVEADASWVAVEVRDDGPGLPETERMVFSDRTETPLDHATGLGLWLVDWTVRDLGGRVEHEPNDPRGTVIRVWLPAAAGTDADGGPSTVPDRGAPGPDAGPATGV